MYQKLGHLIAFDSLVFLIETLWTPVYVFFKSYIIHPAKWKLIWLASLFFPLGPFFPPGRDISIWLKQWPSCLCICFFERFHFAGWIKIDEWNQQTLTYRHMCLFTPVMAASGSRVITGGFFAWYKRKCLYVCLHVKIWLFSNKHFL